MSNINTHESEHQQYQFRNLPELNNLAENISSYDNFVEARLPEKYLSSKAFASLRQHIPNGKRLHLTDIMIRQLSEQYVATVMEKDTNVNTDRDQLKNNMNKHFHPFFNPDTFGVEIHEKVFNFPSRIEIDEIALITPNQIPFVVEIEITKHRNSLGKTIAPNFSEKRLNLLQGIFSETPSIGCIIVAERKIPYFKKGYPPVDFVQNGGIITPFPIGRHKLFDIANDIAKKYFH
jgi:hypothetical protein